MACVFTTHHYIESAQQTQHTDAVKKNLTLYMNPDLSNLIMSYNVNTIIEYNVRLKNSDNDFHKKLKYIQTNNLCVCFISDSNYDLVKCN